MKLNNFFNILSIIILVCFGCKNDTSKSTKESAAFSPEYNVRDLQLKIIAGDTSSYLTLRRLYYSSNQAPEFLVWALLMSNKYNYEAAHYDAFFCIQLMNTMYGTYDEEKKTHQNILDSTTIKFSKEYLLKSSDKDLIERNIKIYFKNPANQK